MKKEAGNVGDFMAACICMLMMSALLLSYVDSVRLIDRKSEINQIARKYILKMETVGRLTEVDKAALLEELAAAGASEVRLEGTTMHRVGYGSAIVLHISGKLGGTYEFDEKRVSAAKH